MSRPKAFDEAEVLDRALELFRSRGYTHTSFEDLTATLGISRQSLYDTYGDKHHLHQAALRRYLDRALEGFRRRFESATSIRQAFSDLLDDTIVGACSRGNPGCFMVNAMVELSPHDADTRALAHHHARAIEGMFASHLSAAQRSGEIGGAKDPVALAHFFYHTILGLAVAARALGDRDALQASACIALSALD